MTQSRFARQGQNSGRNGRGSGNGRGQGCGRGTGYTLKPKMSKVGLCKELESNIFDYGVSNAADLMHTMQEKIRQYVGIKYGEDIANKLTNKTTVTIPPPVYSTAILLRCQEWEKHVRRKQMNMRTALDAKLAQLQSASGIQDAVAIAEVENQVKDVAYQQGQEVPYNLTDSEKLEYSNESKMHSHRVTTLEKQHGNVYALIYGQCTPRLGIPIFGFDFWDPHWRRNSDSVYDSKDSGWNIFLKFQFLESQKIEFRFAIFGILAISCAGTQYIFLSLICIDSKACTMI